MAPELMVRKNTDARTYDAMVDGQEVGTLVYELKGSMAVISHTVIEPEYRGRGLGSELVRQALDDIRGQGMTVSNFCGFVSTFMEKNPDYADLLDPVHPGVIVHP
jgi:predicted GNAT family acetyltransferase